MKSLSRIWLVAVVAAIPFISCKKDELPEKDLPEDKGDISFYANIPWTYADDAQVDHNLFYMVDDGPFVYSRTHLALVPESKQLKAFKKRGLNLNNLTSPVSVSVYCSDCPSSGYPDVFEDKIDDIDISFTAVDKGLCINISNFEWDKAYKIVADYTVDTGIRAVTYIKTFDRNRERIQLPLQEYTFTLNYLDESTGFGYVTNILPVLNHYYWESEHIGPAVKNAFEDRKLISKNDFTSIESFNEKELKNIDSFNLDSPDIMLYLTLDDLHFETTILFKEAVLKGDTFSTGKADKNGVIEGEVVDLEFNTYIGQSVESTFKFNYKEN